MSMEKMMTSLINKDQDEFNTAFDSEVRERIAGKMDDVARSITSGLLGSLENIEAETDDTINNTEQ
tara:strand:- start:468 stop:665 length:198 start_codon:yes stop_codon:yes gene_type:complete